MTRLFVFAVALVGCRGLDDPEAGKEEGRASYANFRLASAVGVNTSAANVTIGGASLHRL